MSNVYVVYWSGTGNTQEMAMAIADGAKENGAEVTVWNVDEADIEVRLWVQNSWKKQAWSRLCAI